MQCDKTWDERFRADNSALRENSFPKRGFRCENSAHGFHKFSPRLYQSYPQSYPQAVQNLWRTNFRPLDIVRTQDRHRKT